MDKKRIVVAMSGGVDSTTVAALLKKQGHEVIGITMQLIDYQDAEGGCCSIDHVIDARRTADELGIPHYVVNFMDSFDKLVLKDYVEKYDAGETPIPCILCNQYIKFDLLLQRALELGADYLATGHYARIEEENGKLTLNKAVDHTKDQTYFLYTLTQKELSRLLFPLGGMTKDTVREIAREMGLRSAETPDSTGVCFAPSGNYRDFLVARSEFKENPGDIVNTEGEVLGSHKGIFSYTVGQRRGLGIATGKPMYVVKVDPKDNKLIVGDEKILYQSKFSAQNFSWVANTNCEHASTAENKSNQKTINIKAKVRSRHNEQEAVLTLNSDSHGIVEFKDPQRAITPGQAVVFYQDDKVLGGAWINEVFQ